MRRCPVNIPFSFSPAAPGPRHSRRLKGAWGVISGVAQAGWRCTKWFRRDVARVFLGGLVTLGLGACQGFEGQGAAPSQWLRLGDSDARVRQLLGAAETQRSVPAGGGIGGALWMNFTAAGRFETRMDDGRLVRTQGLELLLDQGRVVKILPDPNRRTREAPAGAGTTLRGVPGVARAARRVGKRSP